MAYVTITKEQTYLRSIGPNYFRLPIPVPALDIQYAIVAEIEAEQALVSATAELVERMEQRIQDTIARVWEG